MKIIEQYLLQLKKEKRRWRRAAAVLTALSLLVATGVSWNLRMTGITIANGATCGQEEHLHTDECPVQVELVCGFDTAEATPEPTEAPTEAPSAEPTEIPAVEPTGEPVAESTEVPEAEPTAEPAVEPTVEPVAEAASEPTGEGEAEYIAQFPEGDPASGADAQEPVSSDETVHVHTDECYKITYLCGYEEHVHLLSCYSDSTADIETAVIWEATLPQRTGDWARDLAQMAQSQLGCGESERNYSVAEDGEKRNGITRYGQWYGNPHGDWSGMFAMFCLHYADIPKDVAPRSPGVYNMMRLYEEKGILLPADEAMGNAGDLVFVDTDENGNADKVLIAVGRDGGDIVAIAGDWENTVAKVTLSMGDHRIKGYVSIAAVHEEWKAQREAENTAAPEEPVVTEGPLPTEGPVETEGPVATEAPAETQEPLSTESPLPTEEPVVTEAPAETEMPVPTEEPVSPEEPVPTEEPVSGEELSADEPLIVLDVEFSEEDGSFTLVAQVDNIEEDMFLWQWQYSPDDSEPWTDIDGAEGLVCVLEGTDENLERYYRVQGRKLPAKTRAVTFAITRGNGETSQEEDGTLTSGSIAPFSITQNSSTYTVDVYAFPVDANGNRIADIALTKLNSFSVTYSNWNNTTVSVQNRFDTSLGTYKSAYFGTATTVSVDNIASVWCSRYNDRGFKYALAYRQTNGTENTKWLTGTSSTTSLYLRYMPNFTVTFESEGFTSLTEKVEYGALPTLTSPGTWSREGHSLVGWLVNGDEQNVYTYEQIMLLPVTANTTYTAKWAHEVTVSFNLGEYAQELYPVEQMVIPYGSSIANLPAPIWRNNAVAMAFDGWFINEELTQQVTAGHAFYEDTILYAKWSPKDEGYYVYFMDFEREGQVPLVLVTYSVTENQTASPYTPGNAPEGKEWNGKWYLDSERTEVYNFSIPVSQMSGYLTGANGRDLYLYPGMQDVCRAIFVTYGTKVDPVTVPVGGTIDLDELAPARTGFEFAGWALADGTRVSGVHTLTETTTFYAVWNAGYVPFEAILRIENANDTGMTQADILGTWYAKSGSNIRVNSAYSGSGSSRKGTHEVVCVIDGVEYPVYKNSALTQKATLEDVYSTYFIYNNTGTAWTDEVNWDDVFTGGEVPYSTRPVSSAGDTIINFDYMRVRKDITFTIPNTNSGGYIDIYKLQQSGLITGSVTYTGTKPTATGQNVSATGVSAGNISWTYTAASKVDTGYNNYYTLHDMKYGQRIYEVYPVGGSWLTARSAAYHQYAVGSGANFSSRRQDLTSDFFSGSGRGLTPYSLTVEFKNQEYIALMYAVECLEGETPDFTLNGVGYKVDTELCEVVKHTGFFAIKALDGCEPGVNSNGTYNGNNKYYTANTISNSARNEAIAISTAKIGDTSVYTLFNETYWSYYAQFNGVSNIKTFSKIYIFYYDRLHMNIQFNFGYDSNGDGSNETRTYEEIAYGERIDEYQFGMPDYERHGLLEREGYEFAGWLDANGFVLETEDWESMIATGDSENSTMIFIAKWEKISNNVVEYYEDRSAAEPFESHYFDDGELMQYPTMTVYPQGWVWQEYGEGQYQRFDWDVPMYGEYGVQEVRTVNGEEQPVNVVRIYGTWDESHTKVVYDPNPPQGGVQGSAPEDNNEYTIWQSEVPVASRGNTANTDPDMVFVGWKLDRDGVVYQPGDHVPVRWPRTMIFTAQWAKAEDVVYLRYDPNGGTPADIYPNDSGFPYKKGSTAFVWSNEAADGSTWFSRTGYTFEGWNTEPDGSGTHYDPESTIVLTQPVTTLYAQWRKSTYTLSVYKVDSESRQPLTGAQFGLYREENGMYLLTGSLTTGVDGHITFPEMEVDTLYKLVEETPPNGYAIVAKEVFFRLKTSGSSVSLVFYDKAGNVISAPKGAAGSYSSGNDYMTLTVQNLRGYELPATGGAGTLPYILCGLILISAPLVYALSIKRKYGRRSNDKTS